MRILLGEVPWSFLIECLIRIFFIYFLLMVSMRLMGNRMSNLLNNSEMAALVSLAAAIGVPVLSPDRGLLPAFIIATIVVVTQQLIARKAYKSKKFETAALGDISILVEEGKLQLDTMRDNRISLERLIAEFRNNGISNLGRVKRCYLETSGNFSHIFYADPKTGLTLIPKWDEEMLRFQPRQKDVYACGSCGIVTKHPHETRHDCHYCGHHEWTEAIKE